ncbi:hypothetical protein ACN42_g9342 [Penicillium freii]|uniref:Uncharacterized protein n=1 Tax=Penicillium freii TaxID=48697 RepID=A0A101MC12_PENFR|nr:hypothetical protein ACN42_g9342 [Penicillium freii]
MTSPVYNASALFLQDPTIFDTSYVLQSRKEISRLLNHLPANCHHGCLSHLHILDGRMAGTSEFAFDCCTEHDSDHAAQRDSACFPHGNLLRPVPRLQFSYYRRFDHDVNRLHPSDI